MMSVSLISLVNCGLHFSVKSKGRTLNSDFMNFELYLALALMSSNIPPRSISVNKNRAHYLGISTAGVKTVFIGLIKYLSFINFDMYHGVRVTHGLIITHKC